MHKEIICTDDGSHTVFIPSINESYHSSFGAIQESMHVFIERAFNYCEKSEVRILEIGFGAGLNAFLTLVAASLTNKMVVYEALELYPLEKDMWSQLNYFELYAPEFKSEFEVLHTSSWGSVEALTPNFHIKKRCVDCTNLSGLGNYDVIYFDAFSPEKQPNMWSEDVFRALYLHSNQGAIITTYCAKGEVRRKMQQVGFSVERLEGPPGKREMLRGVKLESSVS
jgi:tRNA U34 5-methylaminomethyl-2-thiouridine-forming methyltransferase MnmC